MKDESIERPIGIALLEDVLNSEQEKYAKILGNLQRAFGISEEELTVMIGGEHFSHQY